MATTDSVTGAVPPKAPELPEFPEAPSSTTVPTSTGVQETQIERVIYWRDPLFTGGIFGIVNLLCFLTLWKKYSFLSVFSFCTLWFLIGCFLYINGSKLLVGYLGEDALPKPTFGLQQFSAEAIHAKVDDSVDAINGVMQSALDIVLCKNNLTTIKAVGVTYFLFLVGKIMPDLVMFYLIFLTIFTAPKFYEVNKEEIDKAAGDAQKKFQEEGQKVMKIANEKTLEMREQVSKKVHETATPLMDKMRPQLEQLRNRMSKPATAAATAPVSGQ